MTEEEFEADVQSLMNSLHMTREVAVTVTRQVRYANDNDPPMARINDHLPKS
jgi:hypothetical protein